MNLIRPPAVAGQFYPKNGRQLNAMVQNLLDEAQCCQEDVPKALIAPHAGLVYSGPIAASAYKHVIAAKDVIKRVILLGPCHRVAVRGLALSSADSFQTPLGNIKVDKTASSRILKLPHVHVFDETHKLEHSLEVHLPFLQKVISDFKIVPIVVGDTPVQAISEVLRLLWGGKETLIVVSSDLSHYHSYEEAKKIDTITCNAIERLDPSKISQVNACGRFPVIGLLDIAQNIGLKVKTVDIRNSGDTTGPKDRVVGYGAWIFNEDPTKNIAQNYASSERSNTDFTQNAELDFETQTTKLVAEFGAYLLLLASSSIENGFKYGQPIPIPLKYHPSPLQGLGATFVTLKISNQLRGCIGSPTAHKPLALDVIQNGFNAAFNDPRFPKLKRKEFDNIELSISLLSPPNPISFKNEEDLMSHLRPGTDGLIIEDSGKQSLFLPSVWVQLPHPQDFLQRLKVKAGMKAEHWSNSFKARRFIAAEVSMKDIIKN